MSKYPGWRDVDLKTLKPSTPATSVETQKKWTAKPHIVTMDGAIYELAIAKKFKVQGFRCGSKMEAERIVELILMQKQQVISSLTLQRRFSLSYPSPTGPIEIGDYIADAVYLRNGQTIIEDVKGKPGRTQLYQWKKRHFEAQYAPLTITEVE